MPVLIEAISVVCRLDSIEQKFIGGWDAFLRLVPNRTLAKDDAVVRVGFMAPSDVEKFVDQLQAHGLQFLVDKQSVDIAVVDQLQGFRSICSWLEFSRLDLTGAGQRVAASRFAGTSSEEVVTPAGWALERSLSASFGFVPTEHKEMTLSHVQREGAIDAYRDQLSGGKVYIGRTNASR